MSLQDYREKFPEYDDIPDDQLVPALHQKYGQDMELEAFGSQMGYAPVPAPAPEVIPLARDREMPTLGATMDAAKVAGAGASQAVLGLSESIFRTPEAIQRHIETGVNALPLPEGMADFIKRGNPAGILARGMEGVSIAGANVVADEIAGAQEILSTSDNFPMFKRLSEKGQQADAALKAAIGGDMAPLGQVVTDPEAWAGFIGQAAPSLYAAYKSGGSPAFIAWMESMEIANDVADFEKRTGQKVSPEEFSQAQMQVAFVNTWLEKLGLDKVMKVGGKNILSSMFKGGVTEGTTEGLQELNQNLAKKFTYNPEQELTEGVLPGVMGGAGAGTAGNAAAHTAQPDIDKIGNDFAKEIQNAVMQGADQQAVNALSPDNAQYTQPPKAVQPSVVPQTLPVTEPKVEPVPVTPVPEKVIPEVTKSAQDKNKTTRVGDAQATVQPQQDAHQPTTDQTVASGGKVVVDLAADRSNATEVSGVQTEPDQQGTEVSGAIKKKPQVAYSKPPKEKKADKTTTELWQTLAKSEESQQQPKSTAKELRDIAGEVDPGIKIELLDKPHFKQPNTVQEWKLAMPDGKSAYLRENNDGTIELNAAFLKSGKSRGTALYNIAATFAHNNGKVFMGDREGLSEDAFYRRTENMLSSALKFGTTRHLRPHSDQKIDWVQGDDQGNLERLIQQHYTNITEQVPILKDVTYDFAEKQFVHRDQGRSTPVDFESLATESAGARKAKAGPATLKRAALTGTFLRETSPEGRRHILAALTRQLHSELDPPLKDILYSKKKPGSAGFSVSEGPVTYKAPGPVKQGMTVAHVEKLIANTVLKWADPLPIQVVQSIDDVPPHLTDGDPHNEAAIDLSDMTIYMVADNLANPRRVYEVLAHEAIGHASMEEMLGDDFDKVIDRIQWLKKSGQKEIVQIADEVRDRYSDRDPETGEITKELDREAEAKEIIAVMAEKGIKHPIIDRVIAAIKRFLRKLGLTIPYSAREIRALIAKAESRLKKGTRSKQGKAKPESGGKGMFSKPQDTIKKMGEVVTKYEDVKDILKTVATGAHGAITKNSLWIFTRQHMADVGKNILPGIEYFEQLARKLDARRNNLVMEMAEIGERWGEWVSKNKKEAEALYEVMHEDTKAGVDSSKEFSFIIDPKEGREKVKSLKAQAKSRSGEGYILINRVKDVWKTMKQDKRREKIYPAHKARFDKLSPEAQGFYREIRDTYEKRMRATEKALLDRIERTDASRAEKSRMTETMRLHFESARVQAPYFPIARFGNYWVAATNAETGEREFRMEGSAIGQQFLVRQLKRDGYKDVEYGKKLENLKAMSGASAGFVKDVMSILEKQPGSITKKIEDEVYQLYLSTMPALSVRKHFIHRKNTEGHSQDALRAFADQGFHGSYQLAKLEYSDRLEQSMVSMKEAISDSKNPTVAANFYDEMVRRHEWLMNPQASPWTAHAGTIGFILFLGVSPAAALVNLTQTPLVAYPVLGSRFGYGPAFKELMRASKEFVNGYSKDTEGWVSIENSLKGEELTAFKDLVERGVITKTLTHDLIGRAESSSLIYSGKWAKTEKMVGYLFHHTERMNREVTAMATYRLARAKGLTAKEAVDIAADRTWWSHYDYSNANKARFMQGNVARVALMFRQFSLNTTVLLMRNFYQSFAGESADVKSEARKQFAGILGLHALVAGAYGLPWIWDIFKAVYNNWGDDDEDEYRDLEADMTDFLTEHIGEWGTKALLYGPPYAGIPGTEKTGIDLHSRVGLHDLWLREGGGENLDGGQYFLFKFAQLVGGPLVGHAANIVEGSRLINKGDTMRGVEKMVPKFARDGMKAYRYAEKGVTNRLENPIVDELNAFEIGIQSIGFTPGRVSFQYEKNRKKYDKVNKVKDRRTLLLNRMWIADRADDKKAMKKINMQMNKFGEINPSHRIKPGDWNRFKKHRRKIARKSEHGVYLSRKDRKLVDK